MYLNMRKADIIQAILGLTLTWDVFKFNRKYGADFSYRCLTLTWDVFKYVEVFKYWGIFAVYP